jgi:hypothetical protein
VKYAQKAIELVADVNCCTAALGAEAGVQVHVPVDCLHVRCTLFIPTLCSMIFPRLLSLSSDDFDANASPDDVTHCCVSIVAKIGPSDSEGSDYFYFSAATPSALAESRTFGWGRGILIIESFSWVNVEKSVQRLLAQAARETWQEVALVLNRELLWEFDGHRTQ